MNSASLYINVNDDPVHRQVDHKEDLLDLLRLRIKYAQER